MNILLIKLGALGDISYTLPSLEAIKTIEPEARITWVIGSSSSELLEDHPDIDRRIIVDEARFFSKNPIVRANEVLKLGRFDVPVSTLLENL